eukprot:CAMPEP_0184684048 /NCGR_PEP_ID=MMETSP0312-20130426/13603_1 /TAXON_ID=31354 /ORGANISM="Compsopogon coeruleus, Strain SAG 36.94" /LENGTH=253 /DNA_ID=CAMNT_0027136857 /DNA_START=90 /DNA_END=851 /DNA_ORIENTATION=-
MGSFGSSWSSRRALGSFVRFPRPVHVARPLHGTKREGSSTLHMVVGDPFTDPVRLARWLAADWSNKDQAWENPAFWAHIRTCFRPLPWKLFDGVAFFMESAYEYQMNRPYRAVVIRVVPTTFEGRPLYEFVTYKVKDDESRYYLASHQPEKLAGLTVDQLEKLPECCNVFVEWDPTKNRYEGFTSTKECYLVRKGKNSYLDARCWVYEDHLETWDVGRDPETDEKLWGGGAGPFYYLPSKRLSESFADYPIGA